MFDYFYKREADAFNFIRVPQILVEDEYFKELSSDAILLYSILLQRVGLSYKNKWIDDEERVYIIFTIEEIEKKMRCSKPKAVKILDELDEKNGMGLIQRKRQGLGKPNIIYVKNFMSAFKDIEIKKLNNLTSEVKDVNPGSKEFLLQEVKKTDCNYIDNNKINLSKIDCSEIFSQKLPYGTYKNVFLRTSDYEELKQKISYLDELIERISNYVKGTGKGYKDYKATIMAWYMKEQKSYVKTAIQAPTANSYESKLNL